MVRASFICLVSLTAAVVACGSEPTPPGTLAITLDSLAPVVNTAAITVAGTVTRTPAVVDLPIVATLTVGPVVREDTLPSTGRFSWSVDLALGQNNTLTVSAADATGSTAIPVAHTVRHDALPPSVISVTPATLSDSVTASTIVLRFNEPVVDGSATLLVTHQRAPVGGTGTWSSDRREVTFTPAAPFPPNAVMAVLVTEARDEAGNAGAAFAACFVTAGGSPFNDPRDDVYFADAPGPNLLPVDVTQARFVTTANTLYTILRFAAPRSMASASNANLFALLDLDVDRSASTGFPSLKDLSFGGILPTSMNGADYGIVLLPQTSIADSSVVVQYADTLTGPITFSFLPTECGLAIGFSVPRTALGGLSGEFGTVMYTESSDLTGFFADPAPDASQFIVTVTGAPSAAGPVSGRPGVPVRLRELLWRRDYLLRW